MKTNQNLITLMIGAASGSIATLIGVVLSIAFANVAITATFAAALVAGIFTLIAVVVTGVLGTLCGAYLMRQQTDHVIDVLNQ